MLAKIRALVGMRRMDAELDEELRLHLELQIDENQRRGLSPAEARRVALRDLGGVEQVREAHRDARGIPWLETLWRDLRNGFRSLRRSPGFSAAAVLTLAIGIGANTSIFTAVRGVLLAPLPYPGADRMARVWPETPVNTEFLLHYRELTSAFEALSIFEPTTFALTGAGRPEEVVGSAVTADHFSVVDVRPFLGREFRAEESLPGRGDAVILSFALWQRLFAGSESAISQPLMLNGQKHVVVGVMPADYLPLNSECRLWKPLEIDPGAEEHWDWIAYGLVGRLNAGVTTAQAQDDLRAAIRAYGENRPGHLANNAGQASVVPLHEHMVAHIRPTLLLLAGGVGLILLMICANLASLLLARVTNRRAELALRSALGAGSARLASHVLAESVLLSLAGGVFGLIASRLTLAWLVDLLPRSTPRVTNIEIEGSVLAFSLLVALFSGIVVGLLPALRAASADPQRALGSLGRGLPGGGHRLHNALIAAEIALSVILVSGTGLLVFSFQKLAAVDTGFERDRILTLQLTPPAGAYPSDERRRVYLETVLEQVAATPGVESAGMINRLPMTPGDIGMAFRPADGDSPDLQSVSVRIITPGLIDTLRIPLLRGRGLSPTDHTDTPPVGLVNLRLARRLWGDEDPIGKQLVFDTGEPWFTVVGVVGNIRQHRFDQAIKPQVYRPLAQSPWERRMAVVVRSASDSRGPLAQLEQAIWSVDPNVPITGVTTMDEVIRRSLRDSKSLMLLFSLFGALAMLLGVIGVFGVTAYAVSQRTRETGVRMALGATGSDVVRYSMRRTMIPVGIGLLAGWAASLWLGRFLEGFLYGVEPTDPLAFLMAGLLLAGSAALASFLPARRSASVDPVEALRNE